MQIELHCHAACSDFLRMEEKRKKDFFFIHVPNGSKRGARQGAELKRMGMKAGFPDFLFFFKQNVNVFVELKKEGEGLRENQEEVRDDLKALGYQYHYLIQTDDPQAALSRMIKIVNHHR